MGKHQVRIASEDRIVLISNWTQTLDLIERMCGLDWGSAWEGTGGGFCMFFLAVVLGENDFVGGRVFYLGFGRGGEVLLVR